MYLLSCQQFLIKNLYPRYCFFVKTNINDILTGNGGLLPSKPIVVNEGDNVRLRCGATGIPRPSVEWRKLDGSVIPLGSWQGDYKTMMQS